MVLPVVPWPPVRGLPDSVGMRQHRSLTLSLGLNHIQDLLLRVAAAHYCDHCVPSSQAILDHRGPDAAEHELVAAFDDTDEEEVDGRIILARQQSIAAIGESSAHAPIEGVMYTSIMGSFSS